MEESLGLGKKSCGTETVTETWSWFRLPIPKPGFGRTLLSYSDNSSVGKLSQVKLLDDGFIIHQSKVAFVPAAVEHAN